MRPDFSRFTLLAIFLVVVGPGCGSDDDPVQPGPPPPPVWSEMSDLPASTTLYALWAPRTDLILAAGLKGQIWQWDGQRWTQRISPTGSDLFSIDGSTTGSVVAVGDDGAVLEQVQGSFVLRDASTNADLRGVWRAPSNEFVLVGMNGAVARGSGTSWSLDSTPTLSSLFSVWGSGENDVFAVGAGGTILHYDGAEWSVMSSGTTEILSSVDGTGAGDVYAVGANGIVLHYDGSSWTPMTSTTREVLQSVCAGCGPAAAGANGTVIRMVGGVWTREKIPGAPWLYALAECTDSEQWTAGAFAAYRHNGVAWSNENRGMVPVLRGITSSPDAGVLSVGDNGAVMLDGPSHWRYEDAGAVMRLNSAWTSPDGETFAVGGNLIFRYTQTGWVIENQEPVDFHDVHGSSQQILAVGSDGAIRRRAGTAWGKLATSLPDLHAVYVRGDETWVAGANGTIAEYVVGTWVTRYTHAGAVVWDIMVPDETISDYWKVVVVGAGGLSLGRNGLGDWIEIDTHGFATLHALSLGPGGYLYAVGENGTVLRMVNDQWSALATPTSRTFLAAHSRDGALFLCGGAAASGGVILRYGPPIN
jgi:hypothetical protein